MPGQHKPYRPKPRPKDGGLMPFQERRLEANLLRVRFALQYQQKYGKPFRAGPLAP